MPAASWLPASEGPIVSIAGLVNFSGRAPYFSELDERARLGLGEVAGDLGVAVEDRLVDAGVGDAPGRRARSRRCRRCSFSAVVMSANVVARLALERQVHRPADAVLRGAVGRRLELGALDHRLGQQELLALVVAGDQRLVRRRRRPGRGSCPSAGRCTRRTSAATRRRGSAATPAGRRPTPRPGGLRARARRTATPTASRGLRGDVVALAPAFGVSPIRAPGAASAWQCRRRWPCRSAWPWPSLGVPLGDAVPEGDADGLGCGCARLRLSRRTSRNRSWAVRLTASTRSLRVLAGDLDDDVAVALGGHLGLRDAAAVDPLVDDAGGLLELGLGVAPFDRGERDPGAALEVEPELRASSPCRGPPRPYRSATAIPKTISVRPARGVFFATVLVPLSPCRRRAGL